MRDEVLLYQWLIEGLRPEMKAIAVNWATATSQILAVTVAGLLEFLTQYAAKDISDPVHYNIAENEPDGEPMDIGAVETKGPGAAKRDIKNGAAAANDTKPLRQEFGEKKCFFCGKPGHFIFRCRRYQEARILQQQAWKRRKGASKKAKEQSSGNAGAPTQPAPE